MPECIICNRSDSSELYPGIVRCGNCGHTFADLRLSDQELFDLYQNRYFSGNEYSDYVADKKAIQKNFKLRFKVLRSFLNPARHRNLLEIGCAYGFFLDVIRDFFGCVQGIDITRDGILYARKELQLDVILADFLQQDFADRTFDVVCMWDTIEHLRDPHFYLEKVQAHTLPGSLLAITTGDVESLNSRIKKRDWRLIHPPTHLHYFSQKTLHRLLDQCGFDIVYSRYCGFYRSIDNIAYNILVLRQKRPALYNLLKKSRLTALNFYLNLFDIMYVIARKR